MEARIADHRVMVMALDGEPAEPFASRDGGIVLGPGNRADVFVDTTLGPGRVAPIAFMMESGAAPAVRLVYGDAPVRSAPPGAPAPLPANPLPERMNLSRALRVTLPIEGRGAAPKSQTHTDPSQSHPPQSFPLQTSSPQMRPPVLFTAERGRTVVMALDNRDAGVHVVQLRGHHFRLLDRLDDGWKPYWLDTIPIPGRQTVRIAFVADSAGRWLIEDQAIDASAAVARWFEVK
jgi:FtsP/CotA-like multicopper oxidase with cupredoxin domain